MTLPNWILDRISRRLRDYRIGPMWTTSSRKRPLRTYRMPGCKLYLYVRTGDGEYSMVAVANSVRDARVWCRMPWAVDVIDIGTGEPLPFHRRK